ncbi:hypothetical protein FM111_09600 [Brevundimonas diminuta 3F5N]|uniref:Uncharacterized protein n=1 Tax=Brevundimonas diminuta 3F5N TaxID=1255603 RepID=A0A1R4G5S3_BREDI|nr:hypothetical protein FM111_09600 [Brevundimonas diminuta 3F5N]
MRHVEFSERQQGFQRLIELAVRSRGPLRSEELDEFGDHAVRSAQSDNAAARDSGPQPKSVAGRSDLTDDGGVGPVEKGERLGKSNRVRGQTCSP